jgi:uroporphyrinogen decarboxylase
MIVAPSTQDTGALTGRQRFLKALHAQSIDRPPVWFMRQAGRHLPGYRALRERHSFLDLCREPELCAQASCEPWKVYAIDAVIVFNDILIPLRDMGIGLDFVPGPRFSRLIHSEEEVQALDTPAYGRETDVARCLRAIRSQVGQSAALLGFVGAPFTVASFAIAGLSSQRQSGLDMAVRQHRGTFAALQERLIDTLASYAEAQVEAGADAIQVFESLAADLGVPEYREAGLPFFVRLAEEIKDRLPRTPVILFGRGLWPFIPELAATGAECLSLDSSQHLSSARLLLSTSGFDTALQGNLPPSSLLTMPAIADADAQRLLSRWRSIVPIPARGPTGWIFNLGHGVPERADPKTVLAVAEAVRNFDYTSGARMEPGL